MSDFDIDGAFDDAMKKPEPEVEVEGMTGITVPVRSVNYSTEAMQNHATMAAHVIDEARIILDIGALKAEDAEAFRGYCRTFNTRALPKGVESWYNHSTATVKVCWLFMRWQAMKSHMQLAGYYRLRELSRDELLRAVHYVINHDSLTDLNDVSVIAGVKLNARQVNQLRTALTQSPKFTQLFPDVASRFCEVA